MHVLKLYFQLRDAFATTFNKSVEEEVFGVLRVIVKVVKMSKIVDCHSPPRPWPSGFKLGRQSGPQARKINNLNKAQAGNLRQLL